MPSLVTVSGGCGLCWVWFWRTEHDRTNPVLTEFYYFWTRDPFQSDPWTRGWLGYCGWWAVSDSLLTPTITTIKENI